ncbi:MAG: protein phosphatase 2C domain-containing protein [Firmicutes bacterium]|nr:protein phosphatase 2C domain-containing protein [Bacillota bacterium]
MVKYAVTTNIGVCEKNDDRILVNSKMLSEGFLEGTAENGIIAAVCDGVGGYSHGDKAAEIAATTFSELACEMFSQAEKSQSAENAENTDKSEQAKQVANLLETAKSQIETAIKTANNGVLTAQQADFDHQKMSTTVAGVYINGGNFIVFNVGDSRVYRYRKPYLAQLSVDHTVAEEAAQLGLSTHETEKSAHILTRCIGDKSRCQPSVKMGENRAFLGDIFLVCSDGLSGVVDVDDMEILLAEEISLSEKCQNLLKLALRNGSLDNISVILVEIE